MNHGIVDCLPRRESLQQTVDNPRGKGIPATFPGGDMASYSFIWGMAGENQDFGDMDHVSMNRPR